MKTKGICVLAGVLLLGADGAAQLGFYSREQRIEFTRAWKGDRFPDGRPKVPDRVLERMLTVSPEEAWGVLRQQKYPDQFETDWKMIGVGEGHRVGRAVTAVFMPARPDVDDVIKDHARQEGRVGAGQQSWVIDTLQPGDVFVADLYGKVVMIGDNLATSIFAKSGSGAVINGGIRDLDGIREVKGFWSFYRVHNPGVFEHCMLMGINVPIRIGETTIMPGDVVLGNAEGIMFIPPQYAEQIVRTAEDIHLRDEWSHQMLREGKYTPGQMDARWTKEIEEEFERWKAHRTAR